VNLKMSIVARGEGGRPILHPFFCQYAVAYCKPIFGCHSGSTRACLHINVQNSVMDTTIKESIERIYSSFLLYIVL